jgi:O-antigen/teichoic acid export membrane protein
MVAYCGMLMIKPDIVLATLVCVAVSFVVMLLTTINAGRFYVDSLAPVFRKETLRALAIDGFPLFVSMFLNIYVGNAPKYAIDAYLTDDIQAIFNMVFMPAFVIQIIAHFIFNPILTTYAVLWLSDERQKFDRLIRLVKRQCLFVLGLLAAAILVALTFGLPVLSWWFGADLSAYKAELCVIMFGGAMLAYSVYFSTIIAIIRVQKSLIVCYGLVSLLSLAISKSLVVGGGMMGASILYAILMTILAAALSAVVLYEFRKKSVLLKSIK